jgi:hypothetical protein
MRSLRGTIVSQVRELAARTKCSTISGRGSAIAHEGTYSTTETEPLSQLSELWANLEEQKVERQVLPRGASLISQNCGSRPRAFRYRRPCSSNLTAQESRWPRSVPSPSCERRRRRRRWRGRRPRPTRRKMAQKLRAQRAHGPIAGSEDRRFPRAGMQNSLYINGD